MVGGHIFKIKHEKDHTVFTVRGTGSERNDLMKVKAQIPSKAKPHLHTGLPIWWQGDKVYITILDVPDIAFKKIGFSYDSKHISKESPLYKH